MPEPEIQSVRLGPLAEQEHLITVNFYAPPRMASTILYYLTIAIQSIVGNPNPPPKCKSCFGKDAPP